MGSFLFGMVLLMEEIREQPGDQLVVPGFLPSTVSTKVLGTKDGSTVPFFLAILGVLNLVRLFLGVAFS